MKKYFATILLLFSAFLHGFSQNQTFEEQSPYVYEVNKLYPRVNAITYSSDEEALKLDYKNTYYYLSLNDIWKFKLIKGSVPENPEDFFNSKSDLSDWNEIPVPGNWELNGYGTPFIGKLPFLSNPPSIDEKDNITGIYHNEFMIPKDWKGNSIYLHFGAVSSAFHVWLNGEYVGFSTDSKTPTEFDVTKFIIPGVANKLLLQVSAYSIGSYFETRNAINLSGIEQDVYVYAKSSVNIYDYKVESTLDKKLKDGTLRLQVKIEKNVSGKKEYYLEAELWDNQGPLAKYNKYFVSNKDKYVDVEFNEIVESPLKWTSETPNLYTLLIRLKDSKQNDLDIVACRIGFRTFETKNGLLLVNGVPIKIKGVNRTDYKDSTGYIIDEKTMLEDIKLMKSNNINTVRLLNNPSHPRFYELCDQYGLYVINEANAALRKGEGRNDDLAKDRNWEENTVARVRNMYERDKNHPCILAWSLGNGVSNGICYEEAYKWLKEKDNLTPILFKSAQLSWNSDINSPSCPSLKDLSAYGSKQQKLPLILADLPLMGNCLGGFKTYWDTIYKYPQLQGGCVGNWTDQAIVELNEKKQKEWRFGENSETVRSYNMGGLLLPNREAHPQLAELKNVYANFKVTPVNISEGEFEVTNLNSFTNLKDYELNYRIFSNLKPSVSEGEITVDARPNQSAKFSIMIPKLNTYPNEDYFIIFTLRQKQANGIVSKGTELGFVQFNLKMKNTPKTLITDMDMKDVFSKEDSNNILVYTEDIELTISKQTGSLTRFTYHDKNLFVSTPKLNFYRVPTDNDLEDDNAYNIWKLNDLQNLKVKISNIKFKQISKKTARVIISLTLNNFLNQTVFNVFQTYTIYGTGDVFIENQLSPSVLVQTLPKVGMQMQLPQDFVNSQWFGLSNETYPDRKESGKIGSYTSTTDGLYITYLRPQENGNHTETRWVSFNTNDNIGLFFDMNTNFNFSVYPYDDANIHQAKQMNKLFKKPYYTLNLDIAQAGIGSATCGNNAAEKYIIRNEKTSFSIHIRPFQSNVNKAEDFRLSVFEKHENDVLSTPKITADRKVFDSTMNVTITSDQTDVQIYYTLDGTEPTEKSLSYTKPFPIQSSVIVSAIAVKKDFSPSFTAKEFFNFNYARSITYEFSPNTPYNKHIEQIPFDNIRGKANNLDNNWIGFSGNDLVATIELTKPIDLKSVLIGFGHIPDSWIFLPTEMSVSVSEDNTTFSTPVKVQPPFDPNNEKTDSPNAIDIKADLNLKNVKYIKITAKNLGKMPDWHQVKGLKPWLMIDEISILENVNTQEIKTEAKPDTKPVIKPKK